MLRGWSKISQIESRLWIVSVLGIFLWSVWPAATAAVATISLKSITRQVIEAGTDRARLELQREIQKHFLTYGVYIPLDDIFFKSEIKQANSDLTIAMVRSCGETPIAIWVPLLIRLPYVGERSFEWCWKPSLIN